MRREHLRVVSEIVAKQFQVMPEEKQGEWADVDVDLNFDRCLLPGCNQLVLCREPAHEGCACRGSGCFDTLRPYLPLLSVDEQGQLSPERPFDYSAESRDELVHLLEETRLTHSEGDLVVIPRLPHWPRVLEVSQHDAVWRELAGWLGSSPFWSSATIARVVLFAQTQESWCLDVYIDRRSTSFCARAGKNHTTAIWFKLSDSAFLQSCYACDEPFKCGDAPNVRAAVWAIV